jgi:hypothetical protein
MPGDAPAAESTPPSDGGAGADYSPPPDTPADSGAMPGDYTPPPDDGQGGTYDGGQQYNPDGSMGPPRPRRVKSMHEKAIDAFRVGNEAEGFALLRTDLAVSPSAAADVGTKMAWIPVLKRPAIGARIGIAAHYITPVGDFAESPQPIGSSELKQALASVAQNSARGGQRNNSSETSDPVGGINYGADSGQPGDGKAAAGQLAFYAGDFGTNLLTALKSKMESGEYGLLFQDVAEEVARPAQALDPNNPGFDPNNPGYTGEATPPGGAFAGDGYAGTDTGVPADQAATGPRQLAIGVTWLGKFEKREDLVKHTQDAGVDVLITYEIALAATKVGNLINNKTRIKITDAKKGDMLFTTPVLENRVVMQAREKGQSEEDPVDKQVTRTIAELDKLCKPMELPPAVTAERVKTRLAGLIAEKPADPLPVLLEARFYAAKGLLTLSEMQAAAVALMGEAEYAQLIASTPTGGISDAIGGAISLPGMIDLVRGVNTATGASARAEARKRQADANPGAAGTQPKGRGWLDLLPLGGKKQ